MFQSIVDNLSNFQIIDLFNRISGAASTDLRSTSLCYDTALTTIDREFVWPLPILNEDVSKEVLFLVVKAKFDETVQFLKDSNSHYRRVCQELIAFHNAPGAPGTAKIDSLEYKQSRGKRERMKNSYFETIDERIFQECHLLRYTLEQDYLKALELARHQMELEKARKNKPTPTTPMTAAGGFKFFQETPEAKMTFGHRSSSIE